MIDHFLGSPHRRDRRWDLEEDETEDQGFSSGTEPRTREEGQEQWRIGTMGRRVLNLVLIKCLLDFSKEKVNIRVLLDYLSPNMDHDDEVEILVSKRLEYSELVLVHLSLSHSDRHWVSTGHRRDFWDVTTNNLHVRQLQECQRTLLYPDSNNPDSKSSTIHMCTTGRPTFHSLLVY